MLIFYTDRFVPEGFAGCARGPVIFIRPEYKYDLGLLAHEREHVAQWFCTLGLHSILYLLSDRYKLWSEVRAYKVQVQFSPYNVELFAGFIANDYGLSVTKEESLKLLRQ